MASPEETALRPPFPGLQWFPIHRHHRQERAGTRRGVRGGLICSWFFYDAVTGAHCLCQAFFRASQLRYYGYIRFLRFRKAAGGASS